MPDVNPASPPAPQPVAASAAPIVAAPVGPSVTVIASATAPAAAAPPAGLPLTVKNWNSVNEPGSYVCNDTGRLMRVPVAAIQGGNTPVIEILGPQGPAKVTRLSADPALSLEALRILSTGASVQPRF